MTNKNRAFYSPDKPPLILQTMWKLVRIQFFQPQVVEFRFWAANASTWLFSFLHCRLVFGVFASWLLAGTMNPAQHDEAQHLHSILKDLHAGRRRFSSMSRSTWLEELIAQSEENPYAELRWAIFR